VPGNGKMICLLLFKSCFQIPSVELGQLANAEQFASAMRKYVLMCVDWVNALFMMAGLESAQEKVSGKIKIIKINNFPVGPHQKLLRRLLHL